MLGLGTLGPAKRHQEAGVTVCSHAASIAVIVHRVVLKNEVVDINTLVLLVTMAIVAHFNTWVINRLPFGLKVEQVLIVHREIVLGFRDLEVDLGLSTSFNEDATALRRFVLVRALRISLRDGIRTNEVAVLLQEWLWNKLYQFSVRQAMPDRLSVVLRTLTELLPTHAREARLSV